MFAKAQESNGGAHGARSAPPPPPHQQVLYTRSTPNQLIFPNREWGEEWHEMNEWECEMTWRGNWEMENVGGIKLGELRRNP